MGLKIYKAIKGYCPKSGKDELHFSNGGETLHCQVCGQMHVDEQVAKKQHYRYIEDQFAARKRG